MLVACALGERHRQALREFAATLRDDRIRNWRLDVAHSENRLDALRDDHWPHPEKRSAGVGERFEKAVARLLAAHYGDAVALLGERLKHVCIQGDAAHRQL